MVWAGVSLHTASPYGIALCPENRVVFGFIFSSSFVFDVPQSNFCQVSYLRFNFLAKESARTVSLFRNIGNTLEQLV